MARWLIALVIGLAGAGCLVLAETKGIQELVAQNTDIITQTDAFGVAQQMIMGDLANTGAQAYNDVEIYADVYDADGNAVGEAYGYIVDGCGSAVLDVPIQPGQVRTFALALDLYEEGVAIAKTEIYAEGTPVEPETDETETYRGVTRISDQEVIAVEWQADNTLLYGTGCPQRVFTSYTWSEYNLSTKTTAPAVNPHSILVTDTFVRQSQIMQVTQSGEMNPALLNTSFLTFSPNGDQAAYQNDIHTLYMIRSDGSFRRAVHLYLSRYSLQGINWTPRDNFLAYYFGAYGEDVRYVTVNERGILISRVIAEAVPSVIVPGMIYDGTFAFIAGTFPVERVDTTGYFMQNVAQNIAPDLLFEAEELPGNNYPAPLYYLKDETTRYLYIVRPVDGQNMLQCYHLEGETLVDITPLPLNLATDERAWTWLSPDGTTLAVGATGTHSGLWLVDLPLLGECR